MKQDFIEVTVLLRSLEAVHETGSVTGAADELRISPSAVSQHLKRLSARLGAPVALRSGRGLVLTPIAHELMRRSRPLVDLLEAEISTLASVSGAAHGAVRVGAFTTAIRAGLPRAVAVLQEDHPQLAVTLRGVEPAQALTELRRGTLDLALIHHWEGRPLHIHGDLRVEPLLRDEAEVIVRAEDPLAGQSRPAVAALRGRRWIATPAGSLCHDWLEAMLAGAGAGADIRAEVDDFDAHLDWILAGNGIGLLPRLGRSPLPEGLCAVPLAEPPCRNVSMAVRASLAGHRTVRTVMDAVRAELAPAGEVAGGEPVSDGLSHV